MDLDASEPVSVATFVRTQGRSVVATTAEDGRPEAALVGMAALDDGRLIFDAHRNARKVENLRRDARVAVVVGLSGDVSVQLEGSARVTEGAERYQLGSEYNVQLPGSRALDDDYAVIAVTVDWVRVYDAAPMLPRVTEANW